MRANHLWALPCKRNASFIRTLSDIPTTNPYAEESPIFDLGTIGGGNHFAEFQRMEASLYSLSHGAGRKWARSVCKSRIRNKYDRDSIRNTTLKSRVVCHDSELLFQEAPEAYKNIKHVVAALVEHGLATIVATLRPLLTFKG